MQHAVATIGLCALAGLLGSWQSPSPPPPPPAPAPMVTTVVAVGDILLGRTLGVEMQRTGDYSLPFQSIGAQLAADITFGNFEGTFCEAPPWLVTGMVFRIRPEAVKSFIAGGFDVVSVANNHFGDGGDACMRFSLPHLRANGIAYAGAGNTYDEAHAPAILERNGVKFGFLAYTYADRNDKPPSPPGNDSTGKKIPPAKPAPPGPTIAGRNIANVRRDVAAARLQADVVIVSLHDGSEYLQRVAKETQDFAHAAIDAGAVAVLGHHPHVPQRVESYHGGWIFYSLGNFAFQQNTPPGVRHALLARLTFTEKSLTQVEALPAFIAAYARPRPATAEEAETILRSVGLSNSLLWKAPPATP